MFRFIFFMKISNFLGTTVLINLIIKFFLILIKIKKIFFFKKLIIFLKDDNLKIKNEFYLKMVKF
jgi:hypothetical protein